MKTIILFCSVILCFPLGAQNLLEGPIHRLTGLKKGAFLKEGVFHNGGPRSGASFKSMRHHYHSDKGHERLVMDFEESGVPRVYGHISKEENKIYIDFFDTSLVGPPNFLGKSEFIESVNFFPISEGTLSIEVNFKKKVSLDIFYLENPGRLVLDIKS